jgi:hypothetical protein
MADQTDFRSDFSSTDDDSDLNIKDRDEDLGKFEGKKQKKEKKKKQEVKEVVERKPPNFVNKKEKFRITDMMKSSQSLYDDVALFCNDDILYIEEEKIVFLTTDKNSKIYLPKLDSESPSKTSKGNLFTTKTIKIKATRLNYEHNIFSYKNNYINAGSTVYNLKGGNYVTFYAAGNIWYTMD